MSEKKPVTLMGRLAVQLKMISMDQLSEATAEQGRHPEKRIGDILLELGFIDPPGIERLKKIQSDVIAKHRAKQALAADQVPATRRSKPAAAAPASAKKASNRSPSGPSTAAPPADPKPAVEPAPAKLAPPTPPGESLALQLPARNDSHSERLHEILRSAVEAGASDVHIHSGASIKLRVNGELTDSGGAPTAATEADGLAVAALDEQQTALLVNRGEIDLCYAVAGVGRFRANIYRQQRGFDAVFRSIPQEPPTLEELNLPNALAKFTNYHQGMVLVTGPAGCGKSSTMAALVNLINEERSEHILTIEDPIEYLQRSKRCLVNQRHAGQHTTSFARALRAAIRQDADVILVGEMRDRETIALAITAAEMGMLVFGTLHTNNAAKTIDRIIDAFPAEEQSMVRVSLSESLTGIVSQLLIPTADGKGRVAANEILLKTTGLPNVIREGNSAMLYSIIQSGKGQGMQAMDDALFAYVQDGRIRAEDAYLKATDKARFESLLEGG